MTSFQNYSALVIFTLSIKFYARLFVISLQNKPVFVSLKTDIISLVLIDSKIRLLKKLFVAFKITAGATKGSSDKNFIFSIWINIMLYKERYFWFQSFYKYYYSLLCRHYNFQEKKSFLLINLSFAITSASWKTPNRGIRRFMDWW